MKDMIFTSEGKNITEDIVKRYSTEDGTKIEVGDDFEKPIEVKGLLYAHPHTPFVLNLNPPKKDLSVSIVYFVFCGKHNINIKSRHKTTNYNAWKEVVTAQLSDLESCGLYEYVNHINIVCNYTNIKQLTQMEKIIKKHNLNVSLFSYEGNEFEYRGIHKVWELAQKQQHDLYFYFHSKGITYRKSQRKRKRLQFGKVIFDWRKILTYFQHVESIKKIGMRYSWNGAIWGNFWWATGDYLKGSRKPKKTIVRHYYEQWLGRPASRRGFGLDNFFDCGGISDRDIPFDGDDSRLYIGNYYHPTKVSRWQDSHPLSALRRIDKFRKIAKRRIGN